MLVKKILYFEILLFFSYIFYRILSKKFKLRVKAKDINRHTKDIIDLLLYGLIIFLLVFYQNNGTQFDLKYVLLFIISLVLFGLLLEIPGVGDTVPNFKSWRPTKFIGMIILIIISFYCGTECLVLNNRNINLILIMLSILLVKFVTKYKKNIKLIFHPHHWQIFGFLSLFVIPNNINTKVLSAIYLSFFAHGIIAHSAASIFKN
uniref:Uncharacterized protein n=1 Tax=viral metagenome TaxID=1070528 RepID=A0A6C0IT61_9ZZZZ